MENRFRALADDKARVQYDGRMANDRKCVEIADTSRVLDDLRLNI